MELIKEKSERGLHPHSSILTSPRSEPISPTTRLSSSYDDLIRALNHEIHKRRLELIKEKSERLDRKAELAGRMGVFGAEVREAKDATAEVREAEREARSVGGPAGGKGVGAPMWFGSRFHAV